MCGIVGMFDTRGRRDVDRALLTRMNDSQHHRGPDEVGLHVEPGLGFGHKRLSIIDLSTGQQPLFNEDHSVVVVYNGEVYNYQTLIPELTALGHVFRTKSDTEVIVHAWEAWGERSVDRFTRSMQTLARRPSVLGIPLPAPEREDGREDDDIVPETLRVSRGDLPPGGTAAARQMASRVGSRAAAGGIAQRARVSEDGTPSGGLVRHEGNGAEVDTT